MSHFKVRQHQRANRTEGQFTRRGVDRTSPRVRKGCLDKKGKYGNRKITAGAASMASNKHGVEFTVYKCGYCGFFHLTTHGRKESNMNLSARLLCAISST